MTINIAINTAHRWDVLGAKTLMLLEDAHIAHERITIYVPDESQFNAGAFLLDYGYNLHIAPHNPFDRSLPTEDHPSPGLGTARNLALQHQRSINPDGWTWWFDDDIAKMVRLGTSEAGKARAVPFTEVLDYWMTRMTEEADQCGATMVGVQPAANPLSFSATRTLGLIFCGGGAFAVKLTQAVVQATQVWLTDKEDYERCIKHYLRAGGCLRANDVGFVTKVYDGDGGLQLSRTSTRSHADAAWLVAHYPSLVRINAKRTKGDGNAEILLARPKTNQRYARTWHWEPHYPGEPVSAAAP